MGTPSAGNTNAYVCEPTAHDPLQMDGVTVAAGDNNVAHNHVVTPKTISAKLKGFSPFWKAILTLVLLVAVFSLLLALILTPRGKSLLIT